MKLLSIVGARPQFIKAAVLSRSLKKTDHTEVLVHTGQHFDHNMSEIFFEELEIPKPNYNLGISGGSHASMTSRMLLELENVMLKENPDMVILYGDTNSTLAGALAAAKLFIPICHIEAGVREAGIKNGTFTNPEEINRVLTDRVSSLLMCCTQTDVEYLKMEGVKDNAFFVGDLMYDAFKYYSTKHAIQQKESLYDFDGNILKLPENFYYLTCHREENTRTDFQLKEILEAMNSLDEKVVYPVHPRNRERALKLKEENQYENVIICKPVGYLMSLYLICNAKKIVTDSGGLQREAFFAEKQCVTIADDVAWADTMVGNRNQLAKACKNDILYKLSKSQTVVSSDKPFGNGDSATQIINFISEFGVNKMRK